MRYFVEIAYNGGAYHGWQIQPNANSVQEEINIAFRTYTRDLELTTTGCGRTDTGVHATQFYLHFDTDSLFDESKFEYRTNVILPSDITVKRIFRVNEEFHSRFYAKTRTYQYFINQAKDPFQKDFQYRFGNELDLVSMNEACQYLLNETDFTSFSKVNTETFTNNCDISNAFWKRENEVLIFEITANRFLRNMVRAIVGTMLEVGLGKTTPEQFKQIVDEKDRGKAGTSAPAKGLFLTEVSYDWSESSLPN